MSENTNKIFWISALAIVVVSLGLFLFDNIGDPIKKLFNNSGATSLCTSVYNEGLISCLDASSNTNLGQHSDKETVWVDQISKTNSVLSGFAYTKTSGWDDSSLIFDGGNDVLDVYFDNSKISNNISILINFKYTGSLSSVKTLASNNAFNIKLNTNGSIVATVGSKSVTSTGYLKQNEWYAITVVYDNDLLRLFINDQLNAEVVANLGNISPNNKIVVGSGTPMKLSSFMVWNNAIDESQVSQNMNALNGKVLDIDKYDIDFGYSGNCVPWYAPAKGEYQIELWGAQGSGNGGNGAYASGNITLQAGQLLYVCVGNGGGYNNSNFNGGGGGKYAGGGATDVRLVFNGNALAFDSLKSRIIIAAGGGAGDGSKGGAGGAEIGLDGTVVSSGLIVATGGTQTAGGNKVTLKPGFGSELNGYLYGNNGVFGEGGYSSNSAGGGGGYFGGGSVTGGGAGAGGSSYVSNINNATAIHSSSSSIWNLYFMAGGHYSGFNFTSPKTISGEDKMPDPLSSNKVIGRTGTGYARITLIDTGKKYVEKVPVSIVYEQPGKPATSSKIISDSIVGINFNPVTNAQSYKCYYGITSNTVNIEGAVIAKAGSTHQCSFSGLSQNKTYYYKIVAINGDKQTSSDISSFTTAYKIPNPAFLKNHESADTGINVYYEVDTISTNYVCYIGTSKDNLIESGTVSKDGKIVTCKYEGLMQDTAYYSALKTINGDKQTMSEIIDLNTDYAIPEKTELMSYTSTENSVSLVYGPVGYYTDAKCYYGLTDDDVTGEFKAEVSDGKVYCNLNNLRQGTTYYFRVMVRNNKKVHISEVSSAKTQYTTPTIPELKKQELGSNRIILKYNVDANKDLTDIVYTCIYGEEENVLDKKGTVSYNIDDSISCNIYSLQQNTHYFTKIIARNGNKEVMTDMLTVKTDYEQPKAAIFNQFSLSDEDNSVSLVYNIPNLNYEYTCYASQTLNGTDTRGVSIVDEDTGLLTCKFAGEVGGYSVYYFVRTTNGPYSTDSEFERFYISKTMPTLSVDIDSDQFNEEDWAKENIKLHITTRTKINGQLQALAFCKDEEECTPKYTKTLTEFGYVFNPLNSKTDVLYPDGGLIDEDIYITNESKNNYICFQIITPTEVSETQCYGPYKLDKTAPTITGEDITLEDTILTYDIYKDLDIEDEFNVIKSYDALPIWGTAGQYEVNYVITDEAGNSTEFTRNFIITLTDFDIIYNLDGGTIENAIESYNKETEEFTLPTPTKDGYIFTGWTGTDLDTMTKEVVIEQGSYGYREYTANWATVEYIITYDNNGGIGTGTTEYYENSDDIALYTPTKPGHIFLGWTGSNGDEPEMNVIIPSGSTGNKEYVANWEIIKYEFDLTTVVQGALYEDGLDGYTVDIYIDDILVADDVVDYNEKVDYGSVVRVVANAREGYNITANGDTNAIAGEDELKFEPTWTDNIAPIIKDYTCQSGPSGSASAIITSTIIEEGSGIDEICHTIEGSDGTKTECSISPDHTWTEITLFENKTFTIEAWDKAGNYSTYNAVCHISN